MAGHNRISSLQLAHQLATNQQGARKDIPSMRTLKFFAQAFIKQNAELKQYKLNHHSEQEWKHLYEKANFEVLHLRNENTRLRESNKQMRQYKSKLDPSFDWTKNKQHYMSKATLDDLKKR